MKTHKKCKIIRRFTSGQFIKVSAEKIYMLKLCTGIIFKHFENMFSDFTSSCSRLELDDTIIFISQTTNFVNIDQYVVEHINMKCSYYIHNILK